MELEDSSCINNDVVLLDTLPGQTYSLFYINLTCRFFKYLLDSYL